jgi:hypothetical protein
MLLNRSSRRVKMKKIRIARKDLIRAKGDGQHERLSEVAGEFTLTSSSELDSLIVRILSSTKTTGDNAKKEEN